MLAYSSIANSIDEYIKMEKSSFLECIELFCRSVVSFFGEQYSCRPTIYDLRGLLAKEEERGFPSMI
jgi:hypothetical protein